MFHHKSVSIVERRSDQQTTSAEYENMVALCGLYPERIPYGTICIAVKRYFSASRVSALGTHTGGPARTCPAQLRNQS